MRFLAFLAALSIAFVAALLPASAQGSGVTISPPKFEISVQPGQTIRESIKVINNGTSPLILTATVSDFTAGSEGGQPSFVDDPAKANPAISISQWIHVPDADSITIPPNGKKDIPFTITIPEGAEPGGKYGAIFFSPPKGEGQVAVQQRVGSLLLVSVAGDIVESGQLSRFGTFAKDATDIADRFKKYLYLSRITQENPVSFAVRYENTGNVFIKPTGRIELFNFGFWKVTRAGVDVKLNNQGLEVDKEIVDFIPVNGERGNVLGKSFRTFRMEYAGTAKMVRNDSGVREVVHSGFPIGIYRAQLHLDAIGAGTPDTATTWFIVFPALPIFASALALFLLFFGYRRYSAYSKRKMEEEFKKRFKVSEQHHSEHSHKE